MTKAQKHQKAVERKWKIQVVAEGWHNYAEKGANAWLEKYKRFLNTEKALSMACHARQLGYLAFASRIENMINLGKI